MKRPSLRGQSTDLAAEITRRYRSAISRLAPPGAVPAIGAILGYMSREAAVAMTPDVPI